MLSTRHKSRASGSNAGGFTMETFEMRTMMANNGGMDTDVTFKPEAAPPAIVEYYSPATNTTSSSTTGQTQESRSLGVYNSVFTGPDFGRPVYWAGLCAWSISATGALDMSRAQTEKIAKISKEGGKAIWYNKPIPAGTMTVLDFETPALERKSPAFVADRVRWFKAAAPEVKVGVYGYVMHDLNRQYQARFSDADRTRFDAMVNERREVIEASDFICFDVYMLGPNRVAEDLAAARNTANEYRRLFPDKPIVPFIWGAYHTGWNPQNAVFSDDVTEQYVDMCRDSFDAVMVWGSRADNTKLIDSLARPGNTTLPQDRKTSWSNHPTNGAPQIIVEDDDDNDGRGGDLGGDGEVLP